MARAPVFIILLASLASAVGCAGTTPGGQDSSGDVTADGETRLEGFVPVLLDRLAGTVRLELPAADDHGLLLRCLYTEGLRTGLGSNPVGLDRGQWGDTVLVAFRRSGEQVLIVQENTRFGARSDDADERLAARESFAESVLWAGKGEDVPGGAVRVDVTGFLVRDAHGVVAGLRDAGQGDFRLDRGRSLIDPTAVLAFPDNLEFEALLTFSGDRPGREVRSTAPDPTAISLVQHHSLARLPDDRYEPLPLDPRAGTFGSAFHDTAVPLDAPVVSRLAHRHRLIPTEPGLSPSPVERPIVYYVDRGAPEPVRSALIEGAGWWAAAFEAAGFRDAYRVELLPEGVHPLDMRYHVIEWVHRATRGWSYGHGITDPRTGEILKGHVSLGSLRVRQDRLLFEGLLGTAETGTGSPRDPIELSLARIRQLAAHEVGHTLGLAHHFGASAIPNGSVMDYPAPHLTVTADGSLDTSRAYGVGVGPWDELAITWLYGDLDDAARDEAVARARRDVPAWVSDADARDLGSAHPTAHLWDNGPDPVAGLREALAVRRVGLDGFGADRIAPGQPLADLAPVFATVYLHHRYQLDAAVKVVGGVDYVHALSGEDVPPPTPVAAERQRDALQAVLSVIDPAVLDVPDHALAVLPPPTPSAGLSPEALDGRAAPAFDPLEAAATASRQAVDGLLHPARCARLVDQARRDPSQLSLEELLAALTARAAATPDDARLAAVSERVAAVVIDGIMRLADHPAASVAVRARAEEALVAARGTLDAAGGRSAATRAHLARHIGRFLDRPAPSAGLDEPVRALPPGSPIGAPVPAGCGLDG